MRSGSCGLLLNQKVNVGSYVRERNGAFDVQIRAFGKLKSVGTFPNKEDATLAYAITKMKLGPPKRKPGPIPGTKRGPYKKKATDVERAKRAKRAEKKKATDAERAEKKKAKDAERAEKKKAKDAERPKRAEKKKARAKKAMSPSTGPSSIEPSKTIELNSILLAANSSISSTGIFNDKKFYFHAGVNNNDNGVTAGEAPSFNFRTEDNIVYTFPRWSRSFIAMDHDIRGAAPSSKLFHGAGRDTKRLNGLGQHSTDDCCVLVFTVAGKTTTAAVQFLEETTVNKEQLKVELQKVIDTVKQNWKSFDDIILPWFTTTKHYVAVGLGRDNQNGNGHIKLNIPISVNTKGHCRNYLKENSLTMNEISCTVYCPILCGMIEHVNHRGNTRIQFYSADSGFMPLHQDHGGERAHEYIKCSYMETGVGLTYSGRDSN